MDDKTARVMSELIANGFEVDIRPERTIAIAPGMYMDDISVTIRNEMFMAAGSGINVNLAFSNVLDSVRRFTDTCQKALEARNAAL